MRQWNALVVALMSAVLWGGCSSSTAHLPKPRPPADDEGPPPAADSKVPPKLAGPPAPIQPRVQVAAGSSEEEPAVAAPVAAPAAPVATAASEVNPLLVPGEQKLSEVDRRKREINQLREISKALEAFRERNNEYPPRVVGQGGGISWRVLLLPFLGQRDLYLKFNLSQPWNSPQNKPLLSKIPDVYRSSQRADTRTNFLLVTGANMAYATNAGVGEECADGFENTVFLVAAHDDLACPWTQPTDYTFARETVQHDLFGLHQDCGFAILGGKSGPRRLKASISDEDLLALLTPAGGERVERDKVASYPYPEVEQEIIAELEQNPRQRFAAANSAVALATSSGEASPRETATKGPPAGTLVSAAASAAKIDERSPVPDDETLAKVAAGVKEIYGAEYLGAKRPDQKRVFAQKMLAEGDKMVADKTGAFVMYRAARDVAAQAGDMETSLAAIDKMAAFYRIDRQQMATKAIEQAAPLVSSDSDRNRLYDTALNLADAALARDDFAAASSLLTLASSAARRANSPERIAGLTAKQAELQQAKLAYTRVSSQMHALLRDANNPPANAALGTYCCFIKRDWERGLELLARGNDPLLAQLAQRERALPSTAEAQLELADAWWDLAPERQAELERAAVRQHAAMWYERALPKLAASLAKARVEKRLAEMKTDANTAGSGARNSLSRAPR